MSNSSIMPKANILIVDDTLENLRLLSNLLTDQGYKVRGVPKGQKAIITAQIAPPDLILLDILMPEIDGYEVCRQLKAVEKTRDVPVIFLSALNETWDKVKAFQVGGVDYITKPFQVEEVLARVELQLRLRSQEKQLQSQNIRLQQEINERQLLEKRLRSSEAEMRGFFEAMSDIVLFINTEDYSIKIAPTNPERFNPNNFDILDETIKVFSDERSGTFRHQIQQALEQKTIINFEYSLELYGRKISFIASISPLSENTVVWVARDISELRASEERFKMLMEQAPFVVELYDKNGWQIQVNHAYEKLWGIPGENTVGKLNILESQAVQNIGLIEYVKQAYSGEVVEPPESEFDWGKTGYGGRSRWLKTRIYPLKTTDNVVQNIVIVHEDITQEKQAEAALQRRATIDKLLGDISRAFLDQDIDSAIDFTIKIIGEFAGSDRTYILQICDDQKIEFSMTHEWCARGIEPHLQTFQNISLQTFPWIHAQMETGATVYLPSIANFPPEASQEKLIFERLSIQSLVNIPLQHRNQLIGCLGIVKLQTPKQWNLEEINFLKLVAEIISISLARHEAEIAREQAAAFAFAASKAKSEFLANMSHELRTPLTAILGLAEVLQDEVFGPLTAKQHQKLATIEQSGQHLLELINDVLDLSKIESGKMELQLEPTDIQGLCDASLAFVRQQALQKQIQLGLHIPPHIGKIKVDERRIRQVLINLLCNAVKFTPENGAVWIEVQADREQEVVHFSVVDTGIGIAQEDIIKLFRPFVQLDSALNRRYAGTGLGLALVRQVIELHGGSVSLDSEIGRGSRFTVSVPWQQETSVNLPAKPVFKPQFFKINQVLIVEDSAPAAEQVAHYLAEIGIKNSEIYALGTGIVEAAIRVKPDAIVLDLQLPDRSGWDVLAQLQAEPQTQNIPILIISVADQPTRGEHPGIYEYLVKPFSRHQFQLALRKLLSDRHPLKATARDRTTPTHSTPAAPLILLAEDNDTTISTIVEYLEIRGYRMAVAQNGRQALQMAKQLKPNLVLMDIQMPEIDGIEATRLLKTDSELAQIPIIALTALAMPGDREKCLAAGVNEYLPKPVSLKKLAEAIAFLLTPSPPNNHP
jgi:PAS domain S-box-containing protein